MGCFEKEAFYEEHSQESGTSAQAKPAARQGLFLSLARHLRKRQAKMEGKGLVQLGALQGAMSGLSVENLAQSYGTVHAHQTFVFASNSAIDQTPLCALNLRYHLLAA